MSLLLQLVEECPAAALQAGIAAMAPWVFGTAL